MRKKLDDLDLQPGDRMRVFFAGGVSPRILVATGEYSSDLQAHQMRSPTTGKLEWVEGWLVALPVK